MRGRSKISTARCKRAQAYVDAGADAIFPEALQSAEEFRDFAKEMKVPLLANMTEFGKSPLAFIQGTGRARLSDGDFSAERISRLHESDGGIFARSKSARESAAIGSRKCRRGRSFTSCSITIQAEIVDGYRSQWIIPTKPRNPLRNCEVTLRIFESLDRSG